MVTTVTTITDEMPRVYITSDTHFHHKNIIKYCNRPFASVVEMDKTLIDNWNHTVRPQDVVIHCGDFAFTKTNRKIAGVIVSALAHSLQGRKIIVLGNHDDKRIPYHDCGFGTEFHGSWIVGSKVFCHDPKSLDKASGIGRFVYYGHLHDNDISPEGPNWKNVCVEQTNYTPIDITSKLTEDEYRIIVMTAGANCR